MATRLVRPGVLPNPLERDGLYLPSPLKVDSYQTFIPKWDPKLNQVVVLTGYGDTLTKFEDIFEFLTKDKLNITCCNPAMLTDGLIGLMPEINQNQVGVFSKTGYHGDTIEAMRGFINLRVGNSNRYRSRIRNIEPYFEPDTIKTLKQLSFSSASFLSSFSKYKVLYDFKTPATLAKDILLSNYDSFQEIKGWKILARRFPQLEKWSYEGSYGGRMESAGIGKQYQWHNDIVTCHRSIFWWMKSINDLTPKFGGYDSSDVYGWYRINSKIPSHLYGLFNPLPEQTMDGTSYPSGKNIRNKVYPLPYIKLLEYLKIPFEVVQSIRFVGESNNYPYRTWCTLVQNIKEDKTIDLLGVKSKFLYAMTAGKCHQIYQQTVEVTEDGEKTKKFLTPEGEIYLKEIDRANQLFTPMIYSHVLAIQNVTLYLLAYLMGEHAQAIRIDALSTSKPLDPALLKIVEKVTGVPFDISVKDKGDTVYLTPEFKHFPNGIGSNWEEGIDKYPNEDGPWFVRRGIVSLSMAPIIKKQPGSPYKVNIHIPANYGSNREGKPLLEGCGVLKYEYKKSTPRNKSTGVAHPDIAAGWKNIKVRRLYGR